MKKSNRNLLFAVMLLQLQVLYAQNDTTIKANFDEELGFENASRFISKGALECRIYNHYYTQNNYYNVRWQRVTDDKYVYNNLFRFNLQYGLGRRLLFRAVIQNQQTLQGKNFTKPFEFFSVDGKSKSHFNDIIITARYLLHQKQKRWVLAGSALFPMRYQLPKYSDQSPIPFIRLHASILYDVYATSFMRMQLRNTFEFNLVNSDNIPKFVCSPDANFIFTMWRHKCINITALSQFIFRINQSKAQPFTGLQGVVVNSRLTKQIDLNAQYMYHFMGESTGAGHALTLALTWRIFNQNKALISL
jgi:hypothetical protein